MDAAMAATIALKEQTKNRMNFETGYLFCHVETNGSPELRFGAFLLVRWLWDAPNHQVWQAVFSVG